MAMQSPTPALALAQAPCATWGSHWCLWGCFRSQRNKGWPSARAPPALTSRAVSGSVQCWGHTADHSGGPRESKLLTQ